MSRWVSGRVGRREGGRGVYSLSLGVAALPVGGHINVLESENGP